MDVVDTSAKSTGLGRCIEAKGKSVKADSGTVSTVAMKLEKAH
jgi:hypothetical protein